VHAQQERGLGPDRRFVVGSTRAVRRPHLDQARARPRQHVRNPEPVADLDQLAARDEHLAVLGQRGEGQHHRRRVVVDDERGLRAGQAAQHAGEVGLTRAAAAAVEVVLKVRVGAADLQQPGQGRPSERRPAEVRVDDHARRVEDAAKPWLCRGRQLR
jgi:hypothetical protein